MKIMRKVAIYRETPLDTNYRPLFHLAATDQISLEFFDHKGLDWFVIKLWYRSRIVRLVARKLISKTPRKIEPSWGELFKSLFHPFRLLYEDNIVIAFAPFSIMVFYFLLLKILGKNLIYFTSWPYWDGKNQVHNPIFGSRKIWNLFLTNIKSVGVTMQCANELAKSGADARHIPHSVDIHRFVPVKTDDQTKIRLLYVGRVVKEKGVEGLSSTFELLLEKYPHLELTIVGDGPGLGKLEEKKGILCKGHVRDESNLIKEYQSSHIFVQNSFKIDGWEELFGIALIEAMACGLPCIATDCVGPKELVEDGISGFIIPQKDEKALYDKLENLILDKDLRMKFGARGRERAIDFAVESNAGKWLEVILAGSPGRAILTNRAIPARDTNRDRTLWRSGE